MLLVIMPGVIMLSVVLLGVAFFIDMLSVVMPSVTMLCVAAPVLVIMFMLC